MGRCDGGEGKEMCDLWIYKSYWGIGYVYDVGMEYWQHHYQQQPK